MTTTSSYADRVRELTTTVGTSTIQLAGAVAGNKSFTQAFITGHLIYYCMTDGTNWEIGSGVFTAGAPSTIARTNIFSSSNSDSIVSFPAGVKDVFCTIPAAFMWNNIGVNSINGDRERISGDPSPFRTGTWSIYPTGSLYALVGDYVMYYWTHNVEIDANGNFLGRDEAGDCTLWGFTEAGDIRIYHAPINAIGTVPVWTQKYLFDSSLGTETLSGSVITKAIQVPVAVSTIVTNTLTLDLSLSSRFNVSLNANINTLTISNVPLSGNSIDFRIKFTMDGTARSISWPLSIKWSGGTPPTLTSTLNKIDIIDFTTDDGGVTYLGRVYGQNF